MNKHLTLLEHHSLFISASGEISEIFGHIGLPVDMFLEINTFILQNNDNGTSFLRPSYMKGFGQTLKAQQYVGIIETSNGTVIEILPKIGNDNAEGARAVFLKMLKTLKNSPFRHYNTASLKTTSMHLLEIFITMFCEELTVLVRKGLKSTYINQEENAKFLKGRLKTSEHIRKNIVHKERFYVAFDEYQVNRIENRLIRTTLEFLYGKSISSSNKKRLREFLFVFNGIEPIYDIKSSFQNLQIDRQMRAYELVLHWCKLFLHQESFTSLKGKSIAFALLFDMNRVFEDYVAFCLKKKYPESIIQTQVSSEYLIVNPGKEFRLRPDILIDETIVADTKWKLLDSSKTHFGISQSDIYQMYAYGKKYKKTKIVCLIYPKIDNFPVGKELKYEFEDNLFLKVLSFDCELGEIVNGDIFI
ncbi:MAG: McrC family protein [Spirochaetia bacterium]|jgi:5-methylcytosine-specific restriction enzyme subunit McrC|nr:McrC family protein [Spirochaetia bacterium]